MDLKEKVQNIANLANLEYSEQELEQFIPQFEQILSYIDTINKLDLADVEPLTQIPTGTTPLRPDVAGETVSQKDALKNAGKKNDNFFKVPKVFE